MMKAMKFIKVFILVISVSFLFIDTSVAEQPLLGTVTNKTSSLSVLTNRNPFFVDGNNGALNFTDNGIFTGLGTQQNPFIAKDIFINLMNDAYGINISNSNSYFVIENVWINGSSSGTVSGAVILQNATNGVIKDSKFTNNTDNDVIFLNMTQSITLENNNFTNTGSLQFLDSNYTIFRYNTVMNGGQDAVLLSKSSYGLFNDNTFRTGVGHAFILADSSVKNTISNNVVETFGKSLIVLMSSSDNNIILNNTGMGESSWNGLDIQTKNNVIEGNNISNYWTGISVMGDLNIIKNNVVFNSSSDGMDISSANDILVTGNLIKNSINGHGIRIRTQRSMFSQNIAEYNAYSGFFFDTAPNNNVSQNVARFNGFEGFNLFDGSDDFNFTDNIAYNNSRVGFYIAAYSEGNKMTDNFAYNNTGYGLYIQSPAINNTIYKNYFVTNNQGGVQAYSMESSIKLTDGTSGNYYSDYTGLDTNSDGIGETNYTFDGSAILNDTKPLVSLLTLTSPSDFGVSEGSTGNTVDWTATTNLQPVKFSTFIDNVLQITDTWDSGVKINQGVDGLALGPHTIRVEISDISGNTIQDSVSIFVTDTTPPIISDVTVCVNDLCDILTTTDQVTYQAGTILNVTWTLKDLHPDSYVLLKDGLEINSNTWTSGFFVTTSFGFSVASGVYNLTLVVNDTAGNQAVKTFIVTIESPPQSSDTASKSTVTTDTSEEQPTAPGWTIIVFTISISAIYLVRKRRKII